MGVGERVLELEDVADVGAPEPVDRVVRDDPVRDEVVGALDVQVVHGLPELNALDRLDDVIAAVLVEHHHAGLYLRRRR